MKASSLSGCCGGLRGLAGPSTIRSGRARGGLAAGSDRHVARVFQDRGGPRGPGRGPAGDRRRRRGPRERGRLHRIRREGDARDDRLHDRARAGPGLHADHARPGRPARPAPDGRGEHRPAPDALHGGRRPRLLQDRHQRPGAGADHPGDHRPGHEARRPRPTRSHVPARGQGRRRAPPGRPHRGGCRPRPARGAQAGGRALRDPRRRRRRQPREAPRDRGRVRPAHPLDRDPDRLPPPPRKARPSRVGGRDADAIRARADHHLRRPARAGEQPGRHRHRAISPAHRPRSSGSTRRASPATCSSRSAATAAISSTWHSR